MLRSRKDVYQIGYPAPPGKHYRKFIRFTQEHAGKTLLDLGCGAGAYSKALSELGFRCIGCDVNLDYLKTARDNGVHVVAVDSALPFADRSFETVILFEVLEHVLDFGEIISEAFRVARRNVLVTVPNSERLDLLRGNDVTYAHMLSADHLHFFDPQSLKSMLEPYSNHVSVERADPIYPFWFVSKSIPYYALRAFYRSGILKPRFFTRLYAVASVREN
ncbi:MAG: class I SAM-dependent methyltransferase [Acidobacteria bacterium]|nr:class I SAM-dependent methyltransferase [Acidobacteriota bacterium]